MNDKNKSKSALIEELNSFRNKVNRLEAKVEEKELLLKRKNKTEHKRIKNKFFENRTTFQALIENSADVISLVDGEGGVIYNSPSYNKIMGYSAKERIGEKTFDVIHPDDRKNLLDLFAEILKDSKTVSIPPVRVKHSNGSWIWIEGTAQNLLKNPDVKAIVVNYRDITERKRIEDALRESEERYKQLIDIMPLGIAVQSEGKIVFSNIAGAKIVGAESPEKIIGKSIKEFVSPENITVTNERIRRMLSGEKNLYPAENKYIRLDGSEVPVEVIGVPLTYNGKPAVQLIVQNITERKQMDAALRESEDKFKYLFDHSVVGISITLPSGEINSNKAMSDMLGYSQEELNKLKWQDITHPDDIALTQEAIDSIISGEKESIRVVKRYIHKNGSIVWVDLSASLRRDQNGKPLYFIAVINDVTEHKKMEDVLQKSERKFAAAFYQSNIVMTFAELEGGRFIDVNDNFCECVGYKKSEILGKTAAELGIFGATSSRKPMVDGAKQVGSVKNIEIDFYRRNGEQRRGLFSGSKIEIEGKPHLFSTMVDITERKRAEVQLERKLRETRVRYEVGQALLNKETEEEILDVLIHHAGLYPQGFVVIYTFDDTQGELAAIVRRQAHFESGLAPLLPIGARLPVSSYTLLGRISNEPFVSNDIFNDGRIEPTGREILSKTGATSTAVFPITIENERMCLIMVMTKSASYFDEEKLNLYQTLVEQGAVALRAARLREQIRESQQRFQALVEATSDWIWEVNEDNVYTYASPKVYDLLGYEPTEVVGRTPFDLMLSEESEHTREKLTAASKTHRPIKRLENANRHKDGRTVILETSGVPYFDAQGAFRGYRGIDRDITDRKHAEEELKKNEALLKTAIENLPIIFYMIDSGGIFKLSVGAGLKGLGLKQNQLVGESVFEIYKDYPEIVNSVEISLTGKPTTFVTAIGESSYDNYLVPITDYDGKSAGLVAVALDVTEQKKLQVELLQMQKMESIGTLAGGIAHDFNNILGIILAYSSSIERQINDKEKILEYDKIINQAVNRGAALVRQILTFARQADVNIARMNVTEMIQELLSMLKQTFPKIFTFVEEIEENIPFINADRTQMYQALLNLCVNARDAMPDGGSITISLKKLTLNEVREKFSGADQKSYLMISITDTGIGMDEETRLRIFDPFFTTKEKGKGTGLGLSVVYGIVNTHRGFIDVESELNHGTTFNLYFPCPDENESLEYAPVKGKIYEEGGAETVLFVEDEPALSEMVCFMLKSKGYKVYKASDGMEAVKEFESHKEEIDIVISDMGLPNMTGIEVFRKLIKIDPKVRVILASGFFEPDIKSELFKAGVRSFIQKPYRPDAVLREIREVLDKEK